MPIKELLPTRLLEKAVSRYEGTLRQRAWFKGALRVLGRASVEARTRLLLCRVVSELTANRRLAGKLRVRAQELELARLARAVDSRDHRCVQRVGARKRPHVPRRRSDPRRVFENATQQCDEGLAIERIDGGESQFSVQHG